MRLSHFFISRPIFAIVLSLFITIVGAVAYFVLPVAQYPEATASSVYDASWTRVVCRDHVGGR